MQWSLRKKILFGYGVVLILIALVLAWALVHLLRLGRATDAVLSDNYHSINAAETMIGALERQDSGVLLYILGYADDGLGQFHDGRLEFERSFARARGNVTIPGESEVIEEIETTYAAYLRRFEGVVGDSGSTSRSEIESYHDVLLPAFMDVRRAGAELRQMNEAAMERASSEAGAMARTAVWSMGAVGILALVVGLVFSFTLSQRLVQPIRRIQEAVHSIASENYDVEVASTASDELGLLMMQFNVMASRLRSYRDLNVQRLITEQRKLEAVFQSIGDGLIVLGTDLRIEDVNVVAAHAFGFDPAQMKGMNFSDVANNRELVRRLQSTLNTGSAGTLDEDVVLGDGPNAIHYQYALAPIYTPTEVLIGAIIVLRDVTRHRELDRLKDDFVATASHELRTPLTSIGMSIAMLQERSVAKLECEEQQMLKDVGEDIARLKALVDELLDLSRIQAGRIELDIRDVDVEWLFETAAQMFRAQARGKEIDLGYAIPRDRPAVRADANKILWVLTNLIGNALRHTQTGGTISLCAVIENTHVHVSVQDDGEGIPFSRQARVFDKFVRGDGPKFPAGSGLGLSICRDVVRAHGGAIWVDSEPGEGATFTFALPLTPATEARRVPIGSA